MQLIEKKEASPTIKVSKRVIPVGKTPSKQSYRYSFYKELFLSKLNKIERGRLTLVDGKQSISFGKITNQCPLDISITVYDEAFYKSAVLKGILGIGRAYVEGLWSSSDLVRLVRIMVLNEKLLRSFDRGVVRLFGLKERFYHHYRRNTILKNQDRIEDLDLRSDLFELFLDPSMMYSSGVFESKYSTLEEASHYKMKKICEQLDLKSTDRILEIGTGWGGFAEYAAKHYGCNVTTTTNSKREYDYAKRRIKQAGLEHRVALLCQDYRRLRGRYDKIVVIEMMELVSHHFRNTFFHHCSDLLNSQGMMSIQTVLIPEQSYKRAKRHVDFMKRYVSPGISVPSLGAILRSLEVATDLKLTRFEDITPHYVKTLRRWGDNLKSNQDRAKELGFDGELLRQLEYAFAYCGGAFQERHIGAAQILFSKPMVRKSSFSL